jgi:adenine-specific DNA methylase
MAGSTKHNTELVVGPFDLPLTGRSATSGLIDGLIDSNGSSPHGSATFSSSTDPKLRGGYYTPPQIAALLAQWAIQTGTTKVLEPSAGDGKLVSAIAQVLGPNGRIMAIEVSQAEAIKIRAGEESRCQVLACEFFNWFQSARPYGVFDAVVANPPFLRFKDVPEPHINRAFRVMQGEGLKPNRRTNLWVPFVVAAAKSLRIGGRLAIVLPTEVLQAMYAAELRNYLVRNFSSITIITFRKPIFPQIEQEAVVLLGVKSPPTSSTSLSVAEVESPIDFPSNANWVHHTLTVGEVSSHKWTRYFLSPRELSLISGLERNASDVFRLRDYGEVDIGVVTGNNSFFVLDHSHAQEYGLLEHCIPIIGRVSSMPGLTFESKDWEQLADRDIRCLLMDLGDLAREDLPLAVLDYIRKGEERGVHQGTKCKNRGDLWWNIRSLWRPDAFLTRQVHSSPRIVVNCDKRATCTDTLLRIRTEASVDCQQLAAISQNSLTFASAELVGRGYGGGVLELLPSEAEELLIPRVACQLNAAYLGSLVRNNRVEEAVAEVDQLIVDSGRLTSNDMTRLQAIWMKLRNRRFAHGHKKTKAADLNGSKA